jgi:hypothetical protein
MYKFLLSFIVALFPVVSNAGLFGPSTFEECILDNSKGIASDQAAGMVARACRLKFPESTPSNVSGICKVYWDGFKIVRGDKPNDQYLGMRFEKDGIEKFVLSVPKKMAERLQFETIPDPDKGNFKKYFDSVWPDVSRVCGF